MHTFHIPHAANGRPIAPGKRPSFDPFSATMRFY